MRKIKALPTSPSPEEKKMATIVETTMLNIGQELLELRRSNRLGIRRKRDYADLRTAGDRLSEKKLVQMVNKNYPQDGILGEEGAKKKSVSGRWWFFDPIDGTLPYASGRNNFSISAGLQDKNGELVAGFLYFPAQYKSVYVILGGEVIIHELGDFLFTKNTTIHERAIKLKPNARHLQDAIVGFDFSAGADRQREMSQYFLPLCHRVRSMYIEGSVTDAVLGIIEGRFDVYLHPGATPFDLAASVIIAREAGLVVQRPDDQPINLSVPFTPIVFATSQQLVRKVLRCLK